MDTHHDVWVIKQETGLLLLDLDGDHTDLLGKGCHLLIDGGVRGRGVHDLDGVVQPDPGQRCVVPRIDWAPKTPIPAPTTVIPAP